MQRINLHAFYFLGTVLSPLKNINPTQKLREVIVPIFFAREGLKALLNNQTIQLKYCRPSAQRLLGVLNPLLEDKGVDIEQLINSYTLAFVINNLTEFEHNFSAELQQSDTYSVSQKGIYSTSELIGRAENLFSEDARKQMPENATADIRQAGRCLAFDLPTAAGFHILRAVEAVIVEYMKILKIELKESQRNWGAYIGELKGAKADEKILSVLNQIRELHRNPTLTSRSVLES